MVNFYRRFLPKCAATLQPLHSMLAGNHGSQTLLESDDHTRHAFSAAKQLLTDATMLSHPKAGAPLFTVTDASDTAVEQFSNKKSTDIFSPSPSSPASSHPQRGDITPSVVSSYSLPIWPFNIFDTS